jgi:hypothetical protein
MEPDATPHVTTPCAMIGADSAPVLLPCAILDALGAGSRSICAGDGAQVRT